MNHNMVIFTRNTTFYIAIY